LWWNFYSRLNIFKAAKCSYLPILKFKVPLSLLDFYLLRLSFVCAPVWRAAPGGLPNSARILASSARITGPQRLLHLLRFHWVQCILQSITKGILSAIRDNIFFKHLPLLLTQAGWNMAPKHLLVL
jgi:hypothetical protein